MGRTRRRWGWAAVALVLGFMGGAAALTPKVAGDGWVGSIPTDVLVRIAPMEELAQFVGTAYIPAKPEPSSVGQALVAEVVKRIRADSLQPRHSRVLMDRYARAFPKVLEELAVTRERWPEGESIWASFEAPWLLIWLHKPTRHLRVRLRRTAAGGPGEWREGSAFFTGLMELGVPAPGPVQVDMEYMADGRVWWRGVVPVTTSVEGELHDVLRPVDRPELGLAIVRWLRLSLVRVESEPRDIMLALVEGPLDDRHIAFGMRADVYADGQLIGTGVYATQRSPPARSRRTVNVRTLVPVVYAPGVELSALPDDCDWEIVIHGDGVVALRDFAAWRPAESNPLHPILFRSRDGTPFVRPSDPEEYWSGQLRLPVRLERWMGPVP